MAKNPSLPEKKSKASNKSSVFTTATTSQQDEPAILPAATSVALAKNQTKTFPLVLSAEAHQAIAAAARRDGKSLKDFILTAIFEKIQRAGK